MIKVKKYGSIPDSLQNKFQLNLDDYFTKNSMYNFKEASLSLCFENYKKNDKSRSNFILLKNIKTWILELKISVLTLVFSDHF